MICSKYYNLHSIILGLFKVEYEGVGFVGLNAKTYFSYSDNDTKYSSKGVSKKIPLSKKDYLQVLQTKSSKTVVNSGFILKNRQIYSYSLKKEGLTYFYCKRKALGDGISTTFLDI